MVKRVNILAVQLINSNLIPHRIAVSCGSVGQLITVQLDFYLANVLRLRVLLNCASVKYELKSQKFINCGERKTNFAVFVWDMKQISHQ